MILLELASQFFMEKIAVKKEMRNFGVPVKTNCFLLFPSDFFLIGAYKYSIEFSMIFHICPSLCNGPSSLSVVILDHLPCRPGQAGVECPGD